MQPSNLPSIEGGSFFWIGGMNPPVDGYGVTHFTAVGNMGTPERPYMVTATPFNLVTQDLLEKSRGFITMERFDEGWYIFLIPMGRAKWLYAFVKCMLSLKETK